MERITPTVKAEYDKPTDILMHEPSDEFYYGLMHFESNDYLSAFDRFKAKEEHRNFAETLGSRGIKVHYLTDLLLEDTIDKAGRTVEGGAIDKLREFAFGCLTYHCSGEISETEKNRFEEQKEQTIRTLNPRDLVKIIIERPLYKFKRVGEEIVSSLKFEPQGNLCYTRDQQIVTDKGIVIGKLKNNARKYENQIIKFAYEKTGMPILYEINGADNLEGGDYIPLGEFALIGMGLRTNAGAIKQLLENKVFGFKEIVVVEDPYKKMEQMHLDTYFNIVGKNKAVILNVRYSDALRPKIRVYDKQENGYYNERKLENNDFIEYITKEKGFDIKPVKYNPERNFNVNVLCIGNNELVGVKNADSDYDNPSRNNGITSTLLDFSSITMAYGGPHCLTQVLRRNEIK